MELSTNAVAVIGFVVLFVLMLLRVPVGMAMGLVGVVGYSYIAGSGPALKRPPRSLRLLIQKCDATVTRNLLLLA